MDFKIGDKVHVDQQNYVLVDENGKEWTGGDGWISLIEPTETPSLVFFTIVDENEKVITYAFPNEVTKIV